MTELSDVFNSTEFKMGLPSGEPARIKVWNKRPDGQIEKYQGCFVRSFENGGVVVRDDRIGAVCLPTEARWRYITNFISRSKEEDEAAETAFERSQERGY